MRSIKRLFRLANSDISAARERFRLSIETYANELEAKDDLSFVKFFVGELIKIELKTEAMMLLIYYQSTRRSLLFANNIIVMMLANEGKRRGMLHHAAISGYLNVANILLEKYPELTLMTDRDGRIPLYYAIRNGHTEIVKCLLDDSSPGVASDMISRSDIYGRNSLHYAAMFGHTEIIECLLDKLDNIFVNGAIKYIGWADNKDYTTLHFSAREGHVEVLQHLLQRSAGKTIEYINKQHIHGRTALHYAVKNGQLAAVKCLVAFAGADATNVIAIRDRAGQTALHLAYRYDRENIIEYLFTIISISDFKAIYDEMFIDHTANASQKTILHYAAEFGRKDIIEYVLPKLLVNNTIDIIDRWGNTILHYAAANDHVDIVNFLLFYCLDKYYTPNFIDEKDTSGKTALHYAAMYNCIGVVDVLLPHANINIRDSRGHTALHDAAKNGHVNIVQSILSHEDINPNLLTITGCTALVLALEDRHYEIAELISQHPRTNINQKDSDGLTPIMQLAELELTNGLDWLLGRETLDLMLVDNEGKTILQRALEQQQYFMAKMLVVLGNETIRQGPSYSRALSTLTTQEQNSDVRTFDELLSNKLMFLILYYQSFANDKFICLNPDNITHILHEINNLLFPVNFPGRRDNIAGSEVPELINFLERFSVYYQSKLVQIYNTNDDHVIEQESILLFDEVMVLIDNMPAIIRSVALKHFFNIIINYFQKYLFGDNNFGLPESIIHMIIQNLIGSWFATKQVRTQSASNERIDEDDHKCPSVSVSLLIEEIDDNESDAKETFDRQISVEEADETEEVNRKQEL